VSLDGTAAPLHELVGGESGRGGVRLGVASTWSGRRVGIKSREIYECPGSLALLLAPDLESIALGARSHAEKARLEPRYAELV
jgi:argininosuccinate synthase